MKAFLVIVGLCILVALAVITERSFDAHKACVERETAAAANVGADDGSTVACNDGRLKPVIDPKVGELWCRKPGNPFNDDRIKIVEVRKGYYRYSLEVIPYQSFESYNAPLNYLCDFVAVRSDGTCPEADRSPKVPTKEQLLAEEIENCRKNGLPELAAGDILDYQPSGNPFTKPVDRYIQIIGVKDGYFAGKVFPGGELKSSQVYDLCVGLVYNHLKRRAPKEVQP